MEVSAVCSFLYTIRSVCNNDILLKYLTLLYITFLNVFKRDYIYENTLLL